MFWRLAADLAGLSQCRRLRVGCAVVRPDFSEVVAIGYNGPPAGLPNDGCRGTEGSCGCGHSEASALVKMRGGGDGLAMVVTHSPCEGCAGLVVNCGRIGYVVYGERFRDGRGLEVLERAGVVAVAWSDWSGDERTPGTVPGVAG